MRNIKFTKLSIFSITILALIFASISLFAYWPIAVNPPEEDEKDTIISIGSAGDVTTIISLNSVDGDSSKSLVPLGKVIDADLETDKIYYDINYRWDKASNSEGSPDGAVIIGTLILSSDITVEGSSELEPAEQETLNSLINITFGKFNENGVFEEFSEDVIVNFDKEEEFSIMITLNMPSSLGEYNKIKLRKIFIKLYIEIDDPKAIS